MLVHAREYPSQQLVHVREPRVSNVIGFVDGLARQAKCSDDILQQNAAYNGYHHDTTYNPFRIGVQDLVIHTTYN